MSAPGSVSLASGGELPDEWTYHDVHYVLVDRHNGVWGIQSQSTHLGTLQRRSLEPVSPNVAAPDVWQVIASGSNYSSSKEYFSSWDEAMGDFALSHRPTAG